MDRVYGHATVKGGKPLGVGSMLPGENLINLV